MSNHKGRAKGARLLSSTEIGTALTCQARWDFKYGGRLLDGSTLKRRQTRAILSDGKAWGAAIATWHRHAGELPGTAEDAAHRALTESFVRDVEEQRERGFKVPLDLAEQQADRLHAILDHEIATTTQLPNLTLLEGEFITPAPSRGGRRGSNLYHFQNFIDGYTVDEHGRQWIVEFKLRGKLHPHWLIAMLRQYLWYAWALGRAQGYSPAGVLVMERLNDLPNEPRLVNAKRKGDGIDGKVVSSSTDQRTTIDQYVALCEQYSQEPSPDVVAALVAIRWTQRVPVMFDPDEIAAAGRELTSAGALIGQLDSGRMFPIRNVGPMTCNGCDFKDFCAHPEEAGFIIDQEFVRTVPKRLREPPEAAGQTPATRNAGAVQSPPPRNPNPYEQAQQEAAY